jgi:IS5 family transposase
MKQATMGTGFEKCSSTTRYGQFLAEMDRIVPWMALSARFARYDPKAGDGSPPKDLDFA